MMRLLIDALIASWVGSPVTLVLALGAARIDSREQVTR